MKSVLQINSVVNIGSTGRITEEIGQLVQANGWKSIIAYGRHDRQSKSELIRIGTELEIKLHGIQTRFFDRHGFGSYNATKKLIREIKKINPDIIHLHNLHGYYLNIKVLFDYLSIANIPIVWTFHDCWPMTGHCVYFDFVNCEKWKTQCYSCPQKKEYPASFGFDRSEKNYSLKKELFTTLCNLTIIPVSGWLEDIIKQSYFSNFRLQVINNGINTDIFHPYQNSLIRDNYNLNGKFIILGIASDWSPRKGLKDFVKLSKKLEVSYCIILVGLSVTQIKQLPKNIIGITKTESVEELALFYSSADVFVNPTWEDNFPTTNLESLACGTPVITYRTGGSPEAVSDDTGIVIEKGDIDGLLSAINIIKEKGKINYIPACRERAKRLYDKNDRYMDYLNLYESIIKTHNV
jgi:putative colanic acid biosynthesis glycosyltransferase